jgi:hypothetical protein
MATQCWGCRCTLVADAMPESAQSVLAHVSPHMLHMQTNRTCLLLFLWLQVNFLSHWLLATQLLGQQRELRAAAAAQSAQQKGRHPYHGDNQPVLVCKPVLLDPV